MATRFDPMQAGHCQVLISFQFLLMLIVDAIRKKGFGMFRVVGVLGTMPEVAFHRSSRQKIPKDWTQPLARIVQKYGFTRRNMSEDVFKILKCVPPRIDV